MKSKFILLSCAWTLVVLSGCKDIIPPSVIVTTPHDGATEVARDTTVTATFDEDIFGATVDDTSFYLMGNRSTSGAVSFDGTTNVATFTPSSDLALLTSYTATLTTAITDLVGNALSSDYSWSFTTADGVWGSAEQIDNNDVGLTSSPQVAIDANGNAIAVWLQASDVWANRYTAGSGWGMPERIATDNEGDVSGLQVAINTNGNAVAVWHQSEGTSHNIWANHYIVDLSWGASERIGSGISPQVAVDAKGNAIAVWEQPIGVCISEFEDDRSVECSEIWSSRYTAGSGWGTAAQLENSLGYHIAPQIAVDSDGNAIAIWVEESSSRYDYPPWAHVWANRNPDGAGWRTAERIGGGEARVETNHQVAFDGNGNAIAAWSLSYGLDALCDMRANRYTAGAGWGSSESLKTSVYKSFCGVELAVEANGNAVVVSEYYVFPDDFYFLTAYHYITGLGWGSPERIEADNARMFTGVDVAVDANGNAIVLWGRSNSIFANRYNTDLGWGAPEMIETNDAEPAHGPKVAIDANGSAVAVWNRSAGTSSHIRANRFE